MSDEYQLPMKDGKVDLAQVAMDMGIAPWPRVAMLEALTAHARAEERERCINECLKAGYSWHGSSAVAANELAKILNALGETKWHTPKS